VVHFRVAQQLAAHDRADAAIAHFERSLKFDPGQSVEEYALGETLLDTGRAREAIGPLRQALDAGVHIDRAGADLVRALAASGDRAAAIRVLERVRPARDDDAEGWVALGRLALHLQQPQLVERFSRAAIAARPSLADAHDQLGAGLNLQGRWNEAARELTEAIRLDPLNPAARIGLAVAEASRGDVAGARRQIEEALRLDPRSETARRVERELRSR
jgi:tetratricopeptide (TPR) repeat protein